MDVEKTIEFLLTNQAAADARLSRAEALAVSNAEDIRSLAGKLGELAQMSFDADRRLGERIDNLGERIDRLVSGIGEFMRQDIPPSAL
jgi:hypothetical protein